MTPTIQDYLEMRAAAPVNLSPDASKVLVVSNLTGTNQLYSVPRDGGDPHRLTDLDEPVSGRYLPTSEDILVSIDEGGHERQQIHLMDGDGRGMRPVATDPDHFHRLGGVTRDGKTIAYACNRRNGVDFDVYVNDLASGDERCVWDRGGWCEAAGFSPDGRFLAIGRLTERNGDDELWLVDLEDGSATEVLPHAEEATIGAPHWLPDGSSFFVATNVEAEFERIVRCESSTRAWTPVVERPWDVGCRIDWTGRHLLVVEKAEGFHAPELLDARTLHPRGMVPLPKRGRVTSAAFSQDARYLAYGFASPTEPGDAWLYDIDQATTSRLTDSPGDVATSALAEPELHRYASFDGESVPLFLFRPERSHGDAPVVVNIHGGPESQYTPVFSPVIQYLVANGFAVVAPNVRGSTGYGKRFSHLDDVRKRLDSVRDLEALRGWLDRQPGIDGSRAALMGGSYGGYMVLAGLAFQPDLWAAGVDIVGISSLVTFLENTAAWRRRFREREYGSLEHDHAFLIEASPITHVDRMRAPLMIIHGANDPRVPLGEAQQIHDVLTGRGVPCELLVYHDEGHGLAKLRNRLDAYPKVVDFLHRVLDHRA